VRRKLTAGHYATSLSPAFRYVVSTEQAQKQAEQLGWQFKTGVPSA